MPWLSSQCLFPYFIPVLLTLGVVLGRNRQLSLNPCLACSRLCLPVHSCPVIWGLFLVSLSPHLGWAEESLNPESFQVCFEIGGSMRHVVLLRAKIGQKQVDKRNTAWCDHWSITTLCITAST